MCVKKVMAMVRSIFCCPMHARWQQNATPLMKGSEFISALISDCQAFTPPPHVWRARYTTWLSKNPCLTLPFFAYNFLSCVLREHAVRVQRVILGTNLESVPNFCYCMARARKRATCVIFADACRIPHGRLQSRRNLLM